MRRSSSRALPGPSSSTRIRTGRDDRAPPAPHAPPLSDDESAQIAANLLGASNLDEEVRKRIVHASRAASSLNRCSRCFWTTRSSADENGRWILIRDVAAITVPPTIRTLLSARLDRLGAMERVVAERGAVIGQVFFRGAVEDLCPDEIRPHVGEELSLTRRELIEPQESTFASQETHRFVHIMIREAATTVSQRTRANLHVRFIDWLERVAWDRILEFEEIRGYHLEQAFFILQQLTPNDEKVWRIGVRGSGCPSSAGRRALARGDIPPPRTCSVERPACSRPVIRNGPPAARFLRRTSPSRVPSTKLVRCSTLQSRRRTSSRIECWR